jgi:type VI secretion system protein ImpM
VSGFYGKLPSHGDFLQRGVSDDFVNHWDAWLQEGMACSRSELGEAAWLEVFLTSPLWRFALGSGVVGAPVWAGILLPSVDRVGRYFPLTIVAELPPGVLPFELAVAGNGWFDWAETLARRTLEDELVDLNRLESELRESDALLAAVRPPETRLDLEPLAAADAPTCWLALGPDGDMGRFFAQVAQGLAAHARDPLGLWWSVGSERIAPSVLLTRGLPAAGEFRKLLGDASQSVPASLIDTSHTPDLLADAPLIVPDLLSGAAPIAMDLLADAPPFASGLLSDAAPVAPPPRIDPLPAERAPIAPPLFADAAALLADPLPITPLSLDDAIMDMPPILPPAAAHWQSAAVSNVGRVRDENQDAFVERADDGLWMVADGMGGHQGGKLASQLVAERVQHVAVTGDVTAIAHDLRTAILGANADLRNRGEQHPGFDGGTTVVALCVRGAQGIALWAGDSRLYRSRGGELAQLTRDHSVAEEAGSAEGAGSTLDDGHMLTRAVGGADQLALDELRLDIQPGDRLLLCSDGLYGELTPEEIAARLAAPDCSAATQQLLALALERGGADNATAVVIAIDGSKSGAQHAPN